MAGFVNNHPKGFKMSYACTIKFSHTNPYSHDAQSITILHLGGNQKNHGKKKNKTLKHNKTNTCSCKNKMEATKKQKTTKKQANNRKETGKQQKRNNTETNKAHNDIENEQIAPECFVYLCFVSFLCFFCVFGCVVVSLWRLGGPTSILSRRKGRKKTQENPTKISTLQQSGLLTFSL
jgi:hypothetical protein